MKVRQNQQLTREKHLDHMVKVVPLIVFGYAAQSFVVLHVAPGEFSSISLTILGCFLACMIAAFITYDLKHSVELGEEELCIKFLGSRRSVYYTEIVSIEFQEAGESFSNLIIHTANKKYVFYFIDDAEKIKQWLEEKNQPEVKAA